MLRKEPKIVQVRKKYKSGDEEYHVRTNSKSVLCGRDLRGMDVFSHYSAKESQVCAERITAALASAVELASIAKRLEAIVGDLRRDGLSLFDHGNISKAIGQVNRASSVVLDEAKDRALHEQLRSVEGGGGS